MSAFWNLSICSWFSCANLSQLGSHGFVWNSPFMTLCMSGYVCARATMVKQNFLLTRE